MDLVKGIVIPAGWDLHGNIVKLAIATGDEQEYLIENHHKIEKLKNLLRQEVVVSGLIRDMKEYKTIKVASIRQKET
ncbi:MAG: hypothetical protein V2J65_38410 [Desulfobacteraceae bacterium]|jgi:hypothetical protein|nr:hypothetical protein [Desulfobacteraceae bacterium]